MNELRIQRAAAVGMALATLLLPVVMFTYFYRVGDAVAAWWVPVSLILVVGAGALLLVAGFRGTGEQVGRAALALGAANLVALLLWLPAWNSGAVVDPLGSPPIWPANTVVLPAVALATVYRPRVAVAYTLVGLALLATVQQYAKQGRFGELGYVNAMLTSALVGAVIAVTVAAVDGVRRTDRRREEVLDAASRSARRAARTAERERLDIVVRDHVIAVLRVVGTGEVTPRIQAKAQRTLDRLDGTLAAPPVPDRLPTSQVRLRLREAVNALGDDTIVDLTVPDADATYPYDVAEAVVDAAVEAVSNAAVHAGPGASRALVGSLGPDLARIRVVDDGVGFDPTHVAVDRSGVEMGIRRRMSMLDGGSAWVESEPGGGTMVSLEWRRP